MKKIFRKIHLWLSVPFGLIITLVCFSGAILVFENEVNEWFRHDLYYVETVKESPLPMDKLLEKVATTLPDSVSVTGSADDHGVYADVHIFYLHASDALDDIAHLTHDGAADGGEIYAVVHRLTRA